MSLENSLNMEDNDDTFQQYYTHEKRKNRAKVNIIDMKKY